MADRVSPGRSGRRSKHGVNEALASLYREAEDIVVAGRIKQIEMDNRSKGSMLDDRNLHDLDNVMKIPKRGVAGRDSTGRKAAMAAEELNKQTDKTFTATEQAGEGIMTDYTDAGFENELLIWRTKARNPAYSLKRKYDNPDLEKLRENLTPDQKAFYRDKTKRLFFDLVRSLRHDMVLHKVDQDSTGIFHPNANAQRTHCSYWTKLYHEITCTNIEDRVLKMIRAEINGDAGKEIAAKAKAALSSSFDDMFATKKETRAEAPKGKTRLSKTKSTSTARKAASTLTADTSARVKVAIAGQAEDGLAASLSPMEALKHAPDAERAKVLDAASTAAVSLDSSATSKQSHLDKVFATIKRGRLGDADPRSILLEEAARFDEAAVLGETLKRDTNRIIDDELAGWAVGQARSTQIKKVALGESGLPQSLQVGTVDLEYGDLYSKGALSSRAHDNLMSFDEFYEMHKSAFDSVAVESQVAAEGRAVSRGAAVAIDALVDKMDKLNIAPTPTSGECVLAATDGGQRNPSSLGAIDIVQDFAGKDPNYSSYLKTLARDSAKGRMLSKGVASLTKAKKLRRLPRLGETAGVFTDSRGLIQDISFQGFANHFIDKRLESDDDDDQIHLGQHQDDDLNTASTAATGLEETMDEQPPSPSTEQQQQPRASSSRRKPRSRRARSRPATGDAGESREELHTQLLLAWEILQVSTNSRLVYMRKYCTTEHSRRLAESSRVIIDIGVLFAVRLQTLFIKRLLEDDSFQLPLNLGRFVDEAVSRVPAPLASASAVLSGRGVASAVMKTHFRAAAEGVFVRNREYQSNYLYESANADKTMALRVVDELIVWLTEALLTLYKHCKEGFGDASLLGGDVLKIVEKAAPVATASP